MIVHVVVDGVTRRAVCIRRLAWESIGDTAEAQQGNEGGLQRGMHLDSINDCDMKRKWHNISEGQAVQQPTVEDVEQEEEIHIPTTLPLYITMNRCRSVLTDCLLFDLALGGLHEKPSKNSRPLASFKPFDDVLPDSEVCYVVSSGTRKRMIIANVRTNSRVET